MSQTIKLKRGTSTPTTSNIVSGEVAIDTSAQKLYINDAGTIKEIGGGLGSISVSDVPNLPASKITSGSFDAARIPSLPASRITSGTFAAARIPSLPASKITSGTFDAARIPTLDQYVKTAGDTMSGRLVIEDSSGGDGSWTGGILIDNTATDAGEPAIAFQNSAMGSNYWIVGSNQDNELHFSYGTVFQDGYTKLNLKSDGKLGVGTGAGALTHKFNVTGTSLFNGAVHLAEHLYHADDTNTYLRFETDRVTLVAGGTTKFDSNNTYLTTNSTIPYSQLSGTPTIPSTANLVTLNTTQTNISGFKGFTANVGISSQIQHLNDSNTYLQFDTDRIRLVAGGTTKFDTNRGTAVYENSGTKSSGDFNNFTDGGNYIISNHANISNSPPNSYAYGLLRVTQISGSSIVSQEYIPHSSGEGTFIRFYWSPHGWTSWRESVTFSSDGSGSGLDADLLDGQQGSHYLNYNNLTNKPTIPTSLPANGGNSDTVDNLHASQFLRSDADDTTSGQLKQKGGQFVRSFKYGDFKSGHGSYYASGGSGWYKAATITQTGNCQSGVLYGKLWDRAYNSANAYEIAVVFRNECNFTSDNESHYIEVGCTASSSSDQSNYRNKIRVLLVAASTNSRTYELQFFETPWNEDAWELWGNGWTIYDTPQAPSSQVSGYTQRVNYQSRVSADYHYANVDMRAPHYYDLNNTAYYANPASTSNFNALNVGGSPVWTSGNDGSNSGLDADLLDGQHGSYYLNYNNLSNKPTIPSTANLVTTNTAQTITGVKTFAADVNVSGNRSANFYAFNGAYLKATTDARAPIFYDQDNTGYYADPDGLSNLKDLRTGNDHHTNSPRWDTSFYVAQSQHWYGHSASQVMFLGESANPVRLRGTLNIGTNENVNSSMRLTVRGHADATDSLRAPIFYDTNNTGYYADFNNTGTSVRYGGYLVSDNTGNKGIKNAAGTAHLHPDDPWGNMHLKHSSGGIYHDGAHHHFRSTSGSEWSLLNSDYFSHNSDIRAPLFYDTNNTGYYVDPNSTSNINALNMAGNLVVRNSSPTLYLRDTDHISSMIHQNSNVFYVLRADAADDTGWTTYTTSDSANGRWPLEINLSDSGHYFVIGSDNVTAGGHTVWHAGNDGSGSGLNADLLDGFQGSQFLRSDTSDVMSGELNVSRNGGATGTTAPSYSQANIELQTSSNHAPAISFHRGGYSATTLYEYDGELYTNPWVGRAQAGKLISSGNYDDYVTASYINGLGINYNNLTNKPTIPDTSNLVTTNTAQTISGAKTFTANVGVSGNVSANFYAFNGAYVNATSDVRAPIFYDRNNTGYYVHADSESVLNAVRAHHFRLSSGDGKGLRFWNSDSYKIYMSATGNSSWGGRAPYESTSDYNMYFRMNGGTNRGFVFRSGTTNVAGIDSSGNFNTSGIIKTGNGAASAPAYSFTGDYDSGMFSIGSNAVGFSTGGTQRFKINSNGLLLTGTSSLWVNGQQTITNTRDIANVVNYQNTDGHMQLHRTGAAPLIINRKGTTGSSGTSRGEILNFKSASTKIGRIGYAQPYGGLLYFATGNTSGYGVGVYHFSTSSDLRPVTNTGANNDNAMDLGATSARYDDVYATNGTIQTSDRNEKQDIQELTDAETRAAVTCKGLMRRFRWVDSVEQKGDDARYHFGAIAQDVEAAFTAEGLDAGDYGLFIRSTWWEHEGFSYPSAEEAPEGAVEKTRLGIRYNQLFAFIIGAL